MGCCLSKLCNCSVSESCKQHISGTEVQSCTYSYQQDFCHWLQYAPGSGPCAFYVTTAQFWWAGEEQNISFVGIPHKKQLLYRISGRINSETQTRVLFKIKRETFIIQRALQPQKKDYLVAKAQHWDFSLANLHKCRRRRFWPLLQELWLENPNELALQNCVWSTACWCGASSLSQLPLLPNIN